nr:MAG TPA: hypothetical protein [Caudoviricetes sp.]
MFLWNCCSLRSRLVSGNANNGTNAGAFYSNVNDSWSNTNATVSSPQCFARKSMKILKTEMRKTLPLGKR